MGQTSRERGNVRSPVEVAVDVRLSSRTTLLLLTRRIRYDGPANGVLFDRRTLGTPGAGGGASSPAVCPPINGDEGPEASR